MAKVQNGEKNIAESFNYVSRMHERYRRQTTDGFAIAKTRTYKVRSHVRVIKHLNNFKIISNIILFHM